MNHFWTIAFYFTIRNLLMLYFYTFDTYIKWCKKYKYVRCILAEVSYAAKVVVFRHFKTARFFLCTVERYSIIKSVFLHKFKSYIYNKKIGKPDESLGRKATGPVKWQPVAWNEVHCLFGSVFLWYYFIDVTIIIL